MMNKRVMAIILGVAISISAVSCTSKEEVKGNNKKEMSTTQKESKEENSKDKVEVPNPNKEYKSLKELKKAAEFKFSMPAMADGYKISNIMMVNNEIASISYDKDGDTIQCRASKKLEDISGIYGEFEEKEIKINGLEVKIKNNNGKVSVAEWSKDGINYTISSSKGLEEDVLADMIK